MSKDAAVEAAWSGNYFNYFTEIEEHFQRARGTSLFLLSPLDWALIESWKNSGIPLEAVIKGINDAFEKWHARKQKRRMVNSLAYCAQAVTEAAQRAPHTRAAEPDESAAFSAEELRRHLTGASARIREQEQSAFVEIAAALDALAGEADSYTRNLEKLEQRLTAMEEKLVAAVRVLQTEEDLFLIRQTLEKELRAYRGKMSAEQLSMLERRYLDSALLERAKMPRLSLFYLH